jgi:hypothetical protein
MNRDALMLAGLAAVVAFGTACFGMFSDSKDKPAAVQSCEGLEGQAKIDCEKNKK